MPSRVNIEVNVRPLTFAVEPLGLSVLLMLFGVALLIRRRAARRAVASRGGTRGPRGKPLKGLRWWTIGRR